ncbi:hypothetical protein J132_11385, partial [Termitomyces sp. J132]
AKFNIPKMVIVPVGTKEHRDALVMTRWIQRCGSRISGDIKIVQDSEATRLLGAFIGNGIEDSSIWTPTLEIVARDLKRWEKNKPTIEGKHLMVNIVVGGRMQYRTCVQGMPAQVESELTKVI